MYNQVEDMTLVQWIEMTTHYNYQEIILKHHDKIVQFYVTWNCTLMSYLTGLKS